MNRISPEARVALLEIARSAVQDAARGKAQSVATPPPAEPAILHRPGAAFVTLTDRGKLRGCIGSLQSKHPLWQTVRNAAWDAAVEDPRFAPVGADEADGLDIEISVLSPLTRIAGWEEFEPGRDGIVISKSGRRGVFLPKVASDMKWSREQTLSALCKKAGLPVDAWRAPGMTFEVFGAEVFDACP